LSEGSAISKANRKTGRKDDTMSVQKKSLINNRAAVKKAMIASRPEATDPLGETKALKPSALTNRSLRRGSYSVTAYKKS